MRGAEDVLRIEIKPIEVVEDFFEKHLFTPVLPTPPMSQEPVRSPPPSDFVSVSTAFHQVSQFSPPNDYPPDVVLHSFPDSVFFYCHQLTLMRYTETSFNQLLDPMSSLLSSSSGSPIEPVMISIPEPAPVINCMLHILYGISQRHYSPTLDTFSQAFSMLAAYGCSPASITSLVTPEAEITQHLLELAKTEPLAIYTLAGAHGLEDLARLASRATLSASLEDIDDVMATSMGAVYLRRLFSLHIDRKEALKRLMLVAPEGHSDTPTCKEADRRNLMRAYALAAAYLAWEVVASADSTWIMSGLSPLLQHLSCPVCESKLRGRITSVLQQWDAVRTTI